MLKTPFVTSFSWIHTCTCFFISIEWRSPSHISNALMWTRWRITRLPYSRLTNTEDINQTKVQCVHPLKEHQVVYLQQKRVTRCRCGVSQGHHHLFASDPLHSYYLTPQRNENPSRATNAPQLAQSHKRLSQMQNVVQSIISSPCLTVLLGVCVCAWGCFVVSCVVVNFVVLLSIGCGVYTFSVISETEDAVPPTAMRVCR